MSNETDQMLTAGKQPTAKGINWNKIGILFVALVMIMVICAGSYGFFQLFQANMTLAHTLTDLQTQTIHSQKQLSTLQQTVDGLHQAAEKAQKAQEPALQQEQATTELYSRLIAIDNQLEQLPLLLPESPAKVDLPQTTPTMAITSELPWWQMGLQRSWEVLRKMVVVRYIGQNNLPLIMPEEKAFLYQNLHAQLAGAIWGVLHHNATVYQSSLARTIAWIQRYFLQDAPLTKNLLQELQALQQMNVSITTQ